MPASGGVDCKRGILLSYLVYSYLFWNNETALNIIWHVCDLAREKYKHQVGVLEYDVYTYYIILLFAVG